MAIFLPRGTILGTALDLLLSPRDRVILVGLGLHQSLLSLHFQYKRPLPLILNPF